MDNVVELLTELATRGVKVSVEGDVLACYAPKGALNKKIRRRIAANKTWLIDRFRDYKEFQMLKQPSGRANRTQRLDGPGRSVGGGGGSGADIDLDLAAEAVLDANIRPFPGDGVDFSAGKLILLTGASGFLGAYLLHDLLTTSEAHVYCLVRCSSEQDGAERIKNNLAKYGLWRDDFCARILPLPGDLAEPLLGLGSSKFDRLSGEVDTVYHNGAVVNFIYPYTTLKRANVDGTKEILRLACRAKSKALHFISTVGVFPATTKQAHRILESDSPTNWQGLVGGYPQSKWVAERMVAIASERGLPVRIYRPGFVAGDSTTGVCNPDDLLSRMIKGCIQLGSAPDTAARIEMVPVDFVSKAIVHLSRQRDLGSKVFHIVNPCCVSTREFFRMISSLGYAIGIVPYAEWRSALFDNAATASGNALYPLLAAFGDGPALEMPAFDCSQTLEALRGTQLACPEVNVSLLATYLSYFRTTGFLP